jgi:hypothetical protein
VVLAARCASSPACCANASCCCAASTANHAAAVAARTSARRCASKAATPSRPRCAACTRAARCPPSSNGWLNNTVVSRGAPRIDALHRQGRIGQQAGLLHQAVFRRQLVAQRHQLGMRTLRQRQRCRQRQRRRRLNIGLRASQATPLAIAAK